MCSCVIMLYYAFSNFVMPGLPHRYSQPSATPAQSYQILWSQKLLTRSDSIGTKSIQPADNSVSSVTVPSAMASKTCPSHNVTSCGISKFSETLFSYYCMYGTWHLSGRSTGHRCGSRQQTGHDLSLRQYSPLLLELVAPFS